MRCQSSRIAAFLQADARPMFCWPRSASTARCQVWLGLPNGRFQSGGSPGLPQRQHGGGALVPQTSVSDQVRERMASGGCSDFHIRHMASIWYPQDLA